MLIDLVDASEARKDYLHKVSHEIISENQVIVSENLQIKKVMQIIHLIKSMVFAIIAAADAHPVVRQSDVWQVVLWL